MSNMQSSPDFFLKKDKDKDKSCTSIFLNILKVCICMTFNLLSLLYSQTDVETSKSSNFQQLHHKSPITETE